MKISVELTLSPLQDDFEPIVIDFIKRMRNSGFSVKENALSTQVFGDYNDVMTMLTEEVKEIFEMMDRGLLYMKIVKSDRSEYTPFF